MNQPDEDATATVPEAALQLHARDARGPVTTVEVVINGQVCHYRSDEFYERWPIVTTINDGSYYAVYGLVLEGVVFSHDHQSVVTLDEAVRYGWLIPASAVREVEEQS